MERILCPSFAPFQSALPATVSYRVPPPGALGVKRLFR